jgi:CHAT domain-containing protein
MRRRIVLLLAAGGLAAAGAISAYRVARPAGVIHDLERAGLVRVGPRLSIDTEYRPCSLDSLSTDSIVARENCGENEDPRLNLRALAAAGESLDSDTLRAAALAAVIWWDGKKTSLHRAVTLLEDARRLTPDSVPVLVDLSAVHLVRAQRTGIKRDLLAALDAALEALEFDSLNPAALFNAALALQSLAVDGEAVRAWNAYLEVDSASPWANEARRRRALLAPAPVPPEPTPSATQAEVITFADRDPQRARLVGLDSVLGEWGSAVLKGDAPRADSLLRLAERLGTALERRNGEASLADAVRAVRAARHDGRATRTLARAHRAYAAGQVDFRDPERLAARDSFALVLQLRPPSPALVAWASTFHAATLFYADKHDAAKAVLDSLLEDTDSVRHPALLGRVRWMRGSTLLRASDPAAAREKLAGASATFDRLREAEHFGAARYREGEAAYEEGDTLPAYEMLHQALTALRPHRNSVELHMALLELAEWAMGDGMPQAAMRIQDEGVAVAMRTDHPTSAPEALLARARIHAAAGHASRAIEDLDSAKVRLDSLDEVEFFTQMQSYTRAVVATGADATRYSSELDSAVRFFEGNGVWLLPTLIRRADLRLAAGDRAGADADLDTVTARIRTMSRSAGDFHLRSAIIEQARSHFDRRVMLHVRDGRVIEALQAMERGRISAAPTGGERAPPVFGRTFPPGQVTITYALIGDTLLIWTAAGNTVGLKELRVNRDTLLSTIERASAALETRERAPLAEPHLRRLYDWLIRPVLPRLGPAETSLSILADGEIAGVPFAAFRDSLGRYLIEDHSLRFVTSLSDAAPPEPAPAEAAQRVLLVADPAFDRHSHTTLDPLQGAVAEVDSLKRSVYRDAYVLNGPHATRYAIRARARGASVIHFAGHAVFDDTQPERSFLVLAGKERLSADAVGALDLRGVRLVVLSACRTLPSREGRSDGIAGLSGALLSAGAGGVIGSLWQADDQLTQPLMLAFHRQFAQEGKNPAEALRQAQLVMLHSSDSARSSPAAWAGFRYVER